MHPLVLAVGLRLLMTKFVRSILIFSGVTPSQLTTVAWRTVLGFEVLYNLYALEVCHRKVFNTAYLLRKTTQGARYFILKSGVEKIIVNMIDNDHGMRDSVFRVFGPWDAESEDERGAIAVALNSNVGSRRGPCPLPISRRSSKD